MDKINQQTLIDRMMKDRKLRVEITSKSHYWFFHFYLADHVKCQTPNFHREIYQMTEDLTLGHLVIPAFRGSGKSTILTLSYPLWAVLGKFKYKFILLVGKTQEQARMYMKNIKDELEKNDVLKSDMGPFKEHDIWRENAILLTNHNAMIMAVSSEQSIRGLKHGAIRPQLIIADDLEDSYSVKTRENRDKLQEWLKNDLLPSRETGARFVLTGSVLHQDSLVMRLKREIETNSFEGVYKAYPIVDEKDNSMWPGKYPNQVSVNKLKKEIGDDFAWAQEYMLVPATRETAIIKPEWIQYYGELPDSRITENNYRFAAVGVDLATSQKSTADYVAMVSGKIFGYNDRTTIYILPYPVNERIEFPSQVERLKQLSDILDPTKRSRLFIEDVQYQASLVQELQSKRYPAESVKVHGQDKAARLIIISHYLKQGAVKFPKRGCEQLIEQLVGFGIEGHDDLADAFAILVNQIMSGKNQKMAEPELFIV